MFQNTSIPSIVDEFGNIHIAKEVLDLLVTRYAGPSGARNFKLTRELYQIRQEPGERITIYHSRLKSIWFLLLQPLFCRLLLLFFPLSVYLPMFPKAKGIMSDAITIRSLFLYAVSVRAKVIMLKPLHSLAYSSEHYCFDTV